MVGRASRRLGAIVAFAVIVASLTAGVSRADDAAGAPAGLAASAVFDTLYSRPQAEAAAAKMKATVPVEWPDSWTSLMADALWEEELANRVAFEDRFSQIFQANFTPQELTAGLEMLRMQAAKPLGQRDQPDPAVISKAQSTAAGRSFIQRFNQVAPQFDAAAQAMMRERIPEVFRRLGEKAERTVVTTAPTEAERLQDEVACTLLPADRVRERMTPALQQGLRGLFSDSPGHPEWQAVLDKAVSDEVDASQAEYCLAVGRWLGQGLTVEDSQAILTFLKTPSGQDFRALLAAGALQQPRPEMSQAAQARLARFMTTPAGAKVASNLEQGGKLGGEAGVAYGVSITPGIFRRFGEAASAKP